MGTLHVPNFNVARQRIKAVIKIVREPEALLQRIAVIGILDSVLLHPVAEERDLGPVGVERALAFAGDQPRHLDDIANIVSVGVETA